MVGVQRVVCSFSAFVACQGRFIASVRADYR